MPTRITDLLVDVKGTELVLTFENGESGTLEAFIRIQGVQAINQSELAHLKDQDTFTATIDFSNIHDANLRCPHGALPLPQNAYARYRFHLTVKNFAYFACLAGYFQPE